MDSSFRLFQYRRFLPLFVSMFWGAFNDNFFRYALTMLVTYKLTTSMGTTVMIAIGTAVFIIPYFLFSALAGQIADKYDKAKLIKIIKAAEVGIMLLATLAFIYSLIPLLFLTLFLTGIHSAFFGPAKYSILPAHLKDNEIVSGNGFIEAGTFVAILLGMITGSEIVMLEAGEKIVSFGLVAIALAGFIASLFIPPAPSSTPDLKLNKNVFQESLSIVIQAKENLAVFRSILGITWLWTIGATLTNLLPEYTKAYLGGNSNVLTLFLSLFSIGVAVGALLCNKLLKGELSTRYVPVAILLMSVFMIDAVITSYNFKHSDGEELVGILAFLSSFSHLRVVLDMFLAAVCGGVFSVPLYATMQVKSDHVMRARVIAASSLMNSVGMVLASVILFILVNLGFSLPSILLVLAIVNAMIGLYTCVLLPESSIKAFLRFIFKAFYRVEVRGIENYHKAGERVLVVANHVSFLDPVLLLTFLPDKLKFAINTYIAERWYIKPWLKMVNTFPIDPTNPLSLKHMVEELKNSNKIAIFPEGRITVTGSLMKVYDGPGMVADKANARILPVRISGPEYTIFSRMKGKYKIRIFPKIIITILPAEKIAAEQHLVGKKRRKIIGSQLYNIMSNSVFASSDTGSTLFEELIRSSKINHASRPIIEDAERKTLNYRSLITKSFILGKSLSNYTSSSEYVGIILPNCLANIVLFFALQAFGRVPAMLNFSAGIFSITSVVEASNIKLVITSRKFVEAAKLEAVINALRLKQIKILMLEDLKNEISIKDKIAGLIKGYFPYRSYNSLNNKIDKTSPAVILFTSGTEGTPKGVALSHENLTSNRYQASARIDFNPSDIVFNALPMFHSFGLSIGTLLPIFSGIPCFLYPSPLHYRIIPELVYDSRATILFGTDSFLRNYAKVAHPYDFSSIRFAFAGAEKLKPETVDIWFKKFGVRILEGYGATEASPVIAANTPMYNKQGSIGKIMPGIEWRLLPVEGIENAGRLIVKGPNIMLGYLTKDQPGVIIPPSHTELGKGWYDTGDIVSVDYEGFLTIAGRAKRFAKVGGEMISLSTVENFISETFADVHLAVLAEADSKKGEQLVLITEGVEIKREILISKAREKGLTELFIPKRLLVIDKIPLLATGKIDYSSLEKWLKA